MLDWNPHPKYHLGHEEKLLIEAGALKHTDWNAMPDNLGAPLFPRIIEYLNLYFHPATQTEQVVSALYVFESYALEVLSDVFDLFLAGPPGSGKTNQLESLTMLTEGGLENDLSRAALGRYFPVVSPVIGQDDDNDDDQPRQRRGNRCTRRQAFIRSLCIDEAGSRVNPNERAERDRLLRASYKRGPGHVYTRVNKETGELESFNTFGPKALAFIGSIDPGLASRGFTLTAAKITGKEHYQLVLNEKRRMVDNLHQPLIRELKEWNRWVREWWTIDRVASLQSSENHRAAVASVVQELGANRESELLCTAVTVAMLAGVDLHAELREAGFSLGTAGDEEDDVVYEVNDAVLAVARSQAQVGRSDEIVIRQNDVFKFINKARTQMEPPMKPLGNQAFADGYRAAGIQAAWIRNWSGRNVWVIPTRHLENLRALIEQGGMDNMPNMPHTSDAPAQQSLNVDHVDHVDQEDRS